MACDEHMHLAGDLTDSLKLVGEHIKSSKSNKKQLFESQLPGRGQWYKITVINLAAS